MSKSATLQRIRITPEMRKRLEQLALDDSRTVSDYVRLVLEQHVKPVECFEGLVNRERDEYLVIDINPDAMKKLKVLAAHSDNQSPEEYAKDLLEYGVSIRHGLDYTDYWYSKPSDKLE